MALGTVTKLAKTKEYFVNEGNKIGYMDTAYGSEFNSSALKLVAGEDLIKGRAVYLSDSMTISMCDATHHDCIGVAMFDCKSGEECAIETEGLFKMIAADAITAPAKVTATSATISSVSQKGVVTTATATTQDASTKVVTLGTATCGIALNDAAAAGDVVYVKFTIA